MGLPQKDRRVIATFERMREENRRLKASGISRRPFSTTDPITGDDTIDLSKHDPSCGKCTGGVRGWETHDFGDGPKPVRVICKCVSDGGGVKADPLQQMQDKIEAHHQRLARRKRWGKGKRKQ